ncbi:MAG TPA: choice-of-anchor Q domain-containing protein [Anaerolineaceae bacterium]|nr:choice-of-anchor Q domain-containing protein [Anaerolineaceae bacterium]
MCTWVHPMGFQRVNRSLFIFALIFGLVISLFPTLPVQAATLKVTNINNSGAGSLRQALTSARSGDTITFDPALSGKTIVLASTLIIQKRVTIAGLGAENLAISGNNKYRLFLIDAMANVTITGLTLTNAYTRNQRGSAIYTTGKLILDHVILQNSVMDGLSFGGAGIYNNGTLIITSSTIQNNTDRTYSFGGGGIYNEKTLTVEDSLITGNQVHNNPIIGVYGGGGICNIGTATITRTTISNNVAVNYSSGGGGGIYNSGHLTLSQSQITGNQAPQTTGAGLLNWNTGTVSIDQSTFIDNSAGKDGGAIENTGTMTITNTTLAFNHAASPEYGGGGIDNTEGNLTITNSTIASNDAVMYGGGILNYDGTVSLIFSTLSGNSAPTGGGIYAMGDSAVTTTNLNNAIVAVNAGGDCVNSSGIVNTTTSMVGDGSCNATWAGDPLLGSLQNNGGMTDTLLPAMESPVIDQAACNEQLTDQRGLPRPFDYPEIPNPENGSGCDLGAVEVQ